MSREAIRDFQGRRDRGEATAQALTESCLAKIAAVNPQLNAFVCVDAEGALTAARLSDGRWRQRATIGLLDGVPLAVKDNIDVAGLTSAAGIAALRTRTPQHDAHCIARLRAQGAVFLGKTLMDEAALGALGDNPAFGRCHNPRAHGYTAGGSSSGSAAAVAAGLCTAALGTDTLGSVRIPASYCGIVGYLPSRGLLDAAGVVPLAPSLDRVGVLARSVADAACVAAALSDSIRLERSARVSIGLVRGLDAFVPAEILAAVDDVARVLARAGHRIVEVSAGEFDWAGARRAAFLLTEVEGARVHAALLDDPTADLSRGLRAALEYGRRASPERIERAAEQLDRTRAAVLGWLAHCDVLLLPTTPQPAFVFGTEAPSSQADLTAPASIAGVPALSVPAGVVAGGLPAGAQLIAAHGRDALVLGVAGSIDWTFGGAAALADWPTRATGRAFDARVGGSLRRTPRRVGTPMAQRGLLGRRRIE
jgi:aspartyl-tRNA(Asn)/glutamyl-tRNA(Gln) amidotransferase subunit A